MSRLVRGGKPTSTHINNQLIKVISLYYDPGVLDSQF